MKIINGFLFGALLVVVAGCVGNAPEGQNVLSAECSLSRTSKRLDQKCDVHRLGWKGANGSDYFIGQ
jgi:hypothetical protein